MPRPTRLAARLGLGMALVVLMSGQASRGRIAQFPEARLLCDVAVPRTSRPALPAATFDAVCAALAACWQVPPDLAGSDALEITVRFGLDENGLLRGAPRHTYAAGVPSTEARASLVRGTIDAIGRCTPVTRSPAILTDMVSHDIALHLVYKRSKH